MMLCAALAVLAISCREETKPGGGEDTTPKVVEVSSVVLDREDLSLYVGETQTLQATVLPENATDKTVTWESSNPNVAAVEEGVVTANRTGTAIVTAKAGEMVASCMVTVSNRPVIHVQSVTLNKESITLEVGSSETLIATVSPADASYPEVSWESSDAAVAVVENGVVTAVAEGKAVITASADGKSASCTVTVPHVPVPVQSISLNKTETVIEQGETETLIATVTPDNADDASSVVWSSSNESVAVVEGGVVTAVFEGTATITASAGGKSATCQVTVPHKYVPVESVSLDKTEIYLEVGSTETLAALINPANADVTTVTWSSSNGNVASVKSAEGNANTGVVTAVSVGTATVTAQAEGITATCTVHVKEKVIDVSSVTLDKTSAVLYVKETLLLTATVLPADATDKTVVWSSSNTAVASVAGGLVSALSVGTTVITARAQSGGITASCTIEVRDHTYDGGMEGYEETQPDIDN